MPLPSSGAAPQVREQPSDGVRTSVPAAIGAAVISGAACSELLRLRSVDPRMPPAPFPARDRIDPLADDRVEAVPSRPRNPARTRLLPSGITPSGGTHRWIRAVPAAHRRRLPGRQPEERTGSQAPRLNGSIPRDQPRSRSRRMPATGFSPTRVGSTTRALGGSPSTSEIAGLRMRGCLRMAGRFDEDADHRWWCDRSQRSSST